MESQGGERRLERKEKDSEGNVSYKKYVMFDLVNHNFQLSSVVAICRNI